MHEHTSFGEEQGHRASGRTRRRSAHHRSTHRLLLEADANNARRARRYRRVWDGELVEVWANGPAGDLDAAWIVIPDDARALASAV